MDGPTPCQINFSGSHYVTPSQLQKSELMEPDTDFDALVRIYLLFPQLRNQFVTKLRDWKLTINYKQPITTVLLAKHLSSLSDHMTKCFFKPEVLSIITLPLCYASRVNGILGVISDLIKMLKMDPNNSLTDPEFVAGILGMLLVQIGRLSLSDSFDDEFVNKMDQLAAVIDAQVSIGAYASVDIRKVEEQKLLGAIWLRMHISHSSCFCEQCSPATLRDLIRDVPSSDGIDEAFEVMNLMDLSITEDDSRLLDSMGLWDSSHSGTSSESQMDLDL